MIFLPHTNTVILLEPYCGTITEPGLPVVTLRRIHKPLGESLHFEYKSLNIPFLRVQIKSVL